MTSPQTNTDEVVTIQDTVKRGRGRPKGAKNKPKLPVESLDSQEPKVAKKRGRPKGAKNKPKEQQALPVSLDIKPAETTVTVDIPAVSTEVNSDSHPITEAAKWLEKKMPIVEVQYYKTRAVKQGMSLTNAVSLGILGLFNVQDPEIRKQVKI